MMETYKQQSHAFKVWSVACDSLALEHAAALHTVQAHKVGELPQLTAEFKHQVCYSFFHFVKRMPKLMPKLE